MNTDKVIKKVLGNGKSPSNKMFKDSDGDGVMNVYDCKPYDKNKQGIIHDAKEAIKGKITQYKAERQVRRDVEDQVDSGELSDESDVRKKFTRGSVGERAALKKIEQREIEDATRKESFKQRKQQAVARVRQQNNPRSSSGGNFAGLSNLLVGGSTQPTTTTKRRRRRNIKIPIRKKSKVGKKKKFITRNVKKRTVRARPQSSPGIYGLRI